MSGTAAKRAAGMGHAHRPAGKARSTVHGVRVADGVWESAKRRATSEDVTLNYAVQLLLEGYAKGQIDLPRIIKQYGPRGPQTVLAAVDEEPVGA